MTAIPPVLVLVLAGGRSDALRALGRIRTASALPYGGKYRVIDFTLSNCVHSGLNRIGILTQYAPLSLHGHIGIGRAWDLDRRDGGIRLLQPYVRQRETNWYRGTADALLQNRNVIEDAQARHILVLSGDLVYKMDYAELIRFHEEHDAALTLVTVIAPSDEPERYGYVHADRTGRVSALEEKPKRSGGGAVSGAIYAFRAKELLDRLRRPGAGPDLVTDVIQPMIAEKARVFAYPHRGYWRDIGTVDSYYESNMDLVRSSPPLNLYDPDWLIYTPSEDRSPAVFGGQAVASQSLVSHGARVEGTVRRSVLFPGVHIGPGAVVEDSIVMHDTRVGPGASLRRAIVDKRVVIGSGAMVGHQGPVAEDVLVTAADARTPAPGLCVIGKGSVIPASTRIGPDALIEIGVSERDFPGREVAAGAVVRPSGRVAAARGATRGPV
ncbi:MAG TPA: glucose-1-phosphate adenylyltransferase family protein [Candidatus Dormibacteraeota bacterium]|nr:glucose-1-phosphate adenylyltransferase family protein [Candidatus Dormibacteraeota bacterium]